MDLQVYELLIFALVLILCIGISFIILNKVSKNTQNIAEHSVEESKFAYGIFITSLEEYNEYYIAYELSKFLKIKDNELTESEYNILCKRYINGYFDQANTESKVIQNVTEVLFGTNGSLIMYLKRRFDMMLYKAYPQLGLDNTKIDFS